MDQSALIILAESQSKITKRFLSESLENMLEIYNLVLEIYNIMLELIHKIHKNEKNDTGCSYCSNGDRELYHLDHKLGAKLGFRHDPDDPHTGGHTCLCNNSGSTGGV